MGQVTEAETAVAEVYDHGSEFESADDDEIHKFTLHRAYEC